MTDELLLAATLDRASLPPGQPAKLWCQLEVRAPAAGASGAGPSAGICSMFDCSPSMVGVLDAAKAIVQLLPARHRFSLVGLPPSAPSRGAEARPASGDRAPGREPAESSSRSGGATGLAGGIEHAMRILASEDTDARIILVLTDGRLGSGPEALVAARAAARAGQQLHAVGVGGGYDADELLQLVTPSNGAVWGVQPHGGLTATLASLLGRFDSFVATRARITVELAGGVAPGACFRTSPGRACLETPSGGEAGRIDLSVGNLEAGETYGFLLALDAPASAEGPRELARIVLEYDAAGPARREASLVVQVGEGPAARPAPEIDAALRGVRVTEAARTLAQAHRAADLGRVVEGLELLRGHASACGQARLVADCERALVRAKEGLEAKEGLPIDAVNALVLASTARAAARAAAPDAVSTAAPRPRATVPVPLVPIAAAGPAPAAPSTKDAEEDTSYDLVLHDPGEAIIAVIRELREATGLTLREVTELTRTPPAIFELTALPSRADALRKRLEEAGARIDLRVSARAR